MSLIKKMLKYAVCTYWAPGDTSDAYGKPSFPDPPVEIQCRWEDCIEEIIDHKGRKVLSKAKVYVDRDLLPGGVLLQAALDTLDPNYLIDPFYFQGAWEILKVDKLPNLKNREQLRWVRL